MRSRFAPSPTGLIHVGNARSAVLNWAYVKKNKGKFILRIDDTDILRSKKEFEFKIKENLNWLGIKWDETNWIDGNKEWEKVWNEVGTLTLERNYNNEFLDKLICIYYLLFTPIQLLQEV